eukprot:5351066-Pyramimonas_sp.AAC.1
MCIRDRSGTAPSSQTIDAKSAKWHDKWSPEPLDEDRMIRVFRKVEAAVEVDPRPPITVYSA